MSTEVGALIISMQMDIARLRRDVDEGKGVVIRGMGDIQKAAQQAQNVLSMLGVGLTVGGFVAFVKGTIDMVDGLNDVSQQLGLNIRTLAQWKAAAETNGTTAETVGKAIKALGDYNKDNADKLKAAGITAKDATGQLVQLADIFAAMPEGIARTNLATELFKKVGDQMVPMLQLGSQELQNLLDKNAAYADRVEQFAPIAEEFNNQFDQLKLNASAAGMAIGNDLIAVLGPLVRDLADVTTATSDVNDGWHVMGEVLKTIVVLGGNVAYVFKGIGTEIGGMSAQVAALATGNFDRARGIRESMLEDAAKARADIDAWSENIMKRGYSVPTPAEQGRGSGRSRSNAEAAARLLNPSTAQGEAAKNYERLNKAAGEYLQQLDLQIEKKDKLTQGEKMAIDIQRELSAADAARLQPLLDQIKAREAIVKQLEQEKQLTAGRQYINDLGQAFGRDNAIASARMTIMPELDRDLLENLRQVDERARSAGDSIRRMFADEKITPDQYNQLMIELNQTIDEQKGAVTALNDEQKKLNSSWEYGARRSLQLYLDDAANVADQSSKLWSDAFANMEEAGLNFVKTGKLSFRDLADAFIDQLIRMEMKAAASQIFGNGSGGIGGFLGSLFGGSSSGAYVGADTGAVDLGGSISGYLAGFAKGDAFAGGTSLSQYANTILTSPTLFRFAQGGAFNGVAGEAGPEAVMPLVRTSDGNLGVRSTGGAGGMTVQIGISIDARGTRTEGNSADARGLANRLGDVCRQVIDEEKRSGGRLEALTRIS